MHDIRGFLGNHRKTKMFSSRPLDYANPTCFKTLWPNLLCSKQSAFPTSILIG